MGSAQATTRSRLEAALAVRDAADAVAGGEGPDDRADTVLAALFSVVSPCAAAVERWDPACGRHETLASSGYRDDALGAMEAFFHEDPRFPAIRSQGRPLRVRDIHPAERHGPMFEQVILPARFTDGVSLCLSTGRRYVGALHASTSATGVDDESVAVLRLLSADLARLVDPLDGLPVAPQPEDVGVFAWSPSAGRCLSLSPSARPSLVAAGSSLPGLLAPSRWPSRLGRHLLVVGSGEVLAVEARPSGRWVLVEHRPAPAPCGLSLRELEVLGALTTGATNRMVARSLGVREGTVATHVEHLLTKLGVGNRAGAAAFAVAAGLVHVRDLSPDRTPSRRSVRSCTDS